jgi:hypothetical protein
MDSATRQMLQTVRKRRSNLDTIERLILEEFGESTNGAAAPAVKQTGKRPPRRSAASSNGSSRKDQIHEWLKRNGPATRGEILNGTQLPGGTVGAYLSTEKNLFESRDGKWYAR